MSIANFLTIAAPPYDRYLGSYQLRALLCRVYPNPDCKIEARYKAWMIAAPETEQTESL